MINSEAHGWKFVRGKRIRLCTTCDVWKPHLRGVFDRKVGTEFGLATICRVCATARRKAKQTMTKALWRARERAEPPDTWSVPNSDRETILLLHAATNNWGQTEEGRAWLLGRAVAVVARMSLSDFDHMKSVEASQLGPVGEAVRRADASRGGEHLRHGRQGQPGRDGRERGVGQRP